MKQQPESNGNRRIDQGDPTFPAQIQRHLGSRCPKSLTILGNENILKHKKLALLCSIKCPGDLILQTFDLMQMLRDSGIVVISGFHSPMEKECLRILLKGKQPIIVSLPRSIETVRIPSQYRKPLADGRLLILSCMDSRQKRITTETAIVNNRFISALSEAILVPYAAPSGKTEALCSELASWGKKLYTVQNQQNHKLIQIGAAPLPDPDSLEWRESSKPTK